MSRSSTEVADDTQRLARIENLLPQKEVRDAVHRYIAQTNRQIGDSPRPRVRPRLLARFLAGIAREPSQRLVDAEVETAIREFSRHWTNVLLLAWKRFGKPDQSVQLGANLLPSQERYGGTAEWRTWRDVSAKSRASLLATIALTSEDLQHIYRLFAARAIGEIRGASLELPDGVDVSLDDPWAEPVLRPRGRDTSEPSWRRQTSNTPVAADASMPS